MMLRAVLLATCLLAGTAQAVTYYVSPAGDDANRGTEQEPLRTVQAAADRAEPGDTVLVMEGTYRERVTVRRSGAAGRAITFANHPGQGPTIDGAGRGRGSGVLQIIDAAHVVISGLRVINAEGRGESAIFARGSSHLTIEKCRTYNSGSSGVKLIQCTDVVVDSNEIERACLAGAEECITVKIDSDRILISKNHIHHSRDEGVDVKEGARNVRVIGNHIHHIERQGLYADAWNRETYNIEFNGNVIHDCGFGMAACAETGGLLHDVRYVNNIVYNCQGPGMVVADWGRRGSSHPIDRVAFINNTIFNCGTRWGGGLLVENVEARNILIRNNILSMCGPPAVIIRRPPASIAIDHNLFHGPGGTLGEDAVVGDPLFVDPEGGDFHLRQGSPAIDAGSPDGAPPRDADGQPRPHGEAIDIGADELSPEQPVQENEEAG